MGALPSKKPYRKWLGVLALQALLIAATVLLLTVFIPNIRDYLRTQFAGQSGEATVYVINHRSRFLFYSSEVTYATELPVCKREVCIGKDIIPSYFGKDRHDEITVAYSGNPADNQGHTMIKRSWLQLANDIVLVTFFLTLYTGLAYAAIKPFRQPLTYDELNKELMPLLMLGLYNFYGAVVLQSVLLIKTGQLVQMLLGEFIVGIVAWSVLTNRIGFGLHQKLSLETDVVAKLLTKSKKK